MRLTPRLVEANGLRLLLSLMATVFSVKTESMTSNMVQCGYFTINDTTSSSVFSQASSRSDADCLMRCLNRGCAVARGNDVSGLCQLIVLNDESTAAGPPGTHVRRVVGAEAGDRVWKAADFEQQLLMKASQRFARYEFVQVGNRTFRVIQNRSNGTLSFARNWTEYENGFGDATDFWLGLRTIHELTGSTPRTLRVEAVTWADVLFVCEYSGFTVGNDSTQYLMRYTAYLTGSSNTSGDALTNNNGMKFSTLDRDNDLHSGTCSQTYCGSGGWWYRSCFRTNPSGRYYSSAVASGETTMYWDFTYTDGRKALKSIRLMVL